MDDELEAPPRLSLPRRLPLGVHRKEVEQVHTVRIVQLGPRIAFVVNPRGHSLASIDRSHSSAHSASTRQLQLWG